MDQLIQQLQNWLGRMLARVEGSGQLIIALSDSEGICDHWTVGANPDIESLAFDIAGRLELERPQVGAVKRQLAAACDASPLGRLALQLRPDDGGETLSETLTTMSRAAESAYAIATAAMQQCLAYTTTTQGALLQRLASVEQQWRDAADMEHKMLLVRAHDEAEKIKDDADRESNKILRDEIFQTLGTAFRSRLVPPTLGELVQSLDEGQQQRLLQILTEAQKDALRSAVTGSHAEARAFVQTLSPEQKRSIVEVLDLRQQVQLATLFGAH